MVNAQGPGEVLGGWAFSYERGTHVEWSFCFCQAHALAKLATLETTKGQLGGFSNQLPFKCYLAEVVSVGD